MEIRPRLFEQKGNGSTSTGGNYDKQIMIRVEYRDIVFFLKKNLIVV